MIEHAHDIFRRWAAYVLAPVPGHNLGYGKSTLLKIMEGKGSILPGAPRGSGLPRIHTDAMAQKVEAFLKGVSKGERLLIRTFYLDQVHSVKWKAGRLGLPVRTMYYQLEQVQRKLSDYLGE